MYDSDSTNIDEGYDDRKYSRPMAIFEVFAYLWQLWNISTTNDKGLMY